MPLLRQIAAAVTCAMTTAVRPAVPGALALLVLQAGAAAPAVAQQDLYQVSDVEVDVTAASAVDARERALADGHRKAFERLLTRLTPNGASAASGISQDRIVNLVRDFEVENERTSNVRYLADLTFRFDGEGVRELLRSERIDFAVADSQPLVVLPVFTSEGRSVLWEDPNPWRAAWASTQQNGALVPLIAPLGDLSDISSVELEQAQQGDAEALERLAGNYATNGALVAEARLSGDPEAGGASLAMTAARYQAGRSEGQVSASISQQPEESARQFYARAVEALDAAVQRDWRDENLLDLDNRQEMRVSARVETLGDLRQLQQVFSEVSTVDAATLRYLARGEAQFDLNYFGDSERLRRALSRRDLTLQEPQRSLAMAQPDGLEGGRAPVWELMLPGQSDGRGPRIETDQLEAPSALSQPRAEGPADSAPATLDAGGTAGAGGDPTNGTLQDGGPGFGGSAGPSAGTGEGQDSDPEAGEATETESGAPRP